ncbi:insulin-like peptide INSL5 [Perognathus longimembris pacificus]|uniref:insulin-like peptide INSL5 n=1 Tax=Perognathus longimembris pacificus TaxID=214514 RepID=UPI002018471D|nr:insulin-like peptide INSL5 [Perognathus longimembris pacificus]
MCLVNIVKMSNMKGTLFILFLFSVLLAISEVKSEKTVRLCGLEYVRTIIYICASSRWRRHLEEPPQGRQAERRDVFQLGTRHEASGEDIAYNLPKEAISGEKYTHDRQITPEELWESKKHSVMSRQDLQTLCCTEGCTMMDLSTLC